MADRRRWLTETTRAAGPETLIGVAPAGSDGMPPSLGNVVDLASAGTPGPGPQDIGALIGRAVAELHALPVEHCPFDASAALILDALRSRVGSGEEPVLPDPYNRYPAVELLDIVERQLQPIGQPVALVLVHGDLRPDNMFLDSTGGGESKLLLGELGQLGVGDRHRDLAVVHRHLPAVAGAEALFAFYDAYGTEPDLVRLDAFVLLSLLAEQLCPDGVSA